MSCRMPTGSLNVTGGRPAIEAGPEFPPGDRGRDMRAGGAACRDSA